MWQPTGQSAALLAHHKPSSVSLPTGKARSVTPFIAAICGRGDAVETCKTEQKGDSKKPSMAASGGDPAAAIGGGGLASTYIARLQAADRGGDLAAAGAMGGRLVATDA